MKWEIALAVTVACMAVVFVKVAGLAKTATRVTFVPLQEEKMEQEMK